MNKVPEQSRILIVDDDLVTRTTLNKVLQKSGYLTQLADDGKAGINAFIKFQPHLVLMDVMMPLLDGFQTTKAIRDLESNRAVPILMLTALDDIDSIDDAFDAGATDFITKPINWGLLVQRVKYALRSAQIEDQLRASQAQLNHAQTLAKLGYWEWHLKPDIVTASKTAYQMFAVPPQDDMTFERFTQNIHSKDKLIVQQAIEETLHGHATFQVNFRVLTPEGDINHIEFLGDVHYNDQGEIEKIIGSSQDLSRLHKAETMLQYQATHDPLTELANRNLFAQTVGNQLKEFPKQTCALIVLDLDRFKQINNNFGQEQGDQLLRSISQRISRITRANDSIARLGGDEFAILVRNYKDPVELAQLMNRFHQDISEPISFNAGELLVNYSLGVATYPDDGKSADELINFANMAHQQAKKNGGNQYQFYQSEMNKNAQASIELEMDIRNAIENEAFEVYYQPQVDAKTLQPTGAEALLRWQHPDKGFISPLTFIPIAESTGQIAQLGEYVLRKAIQQTLQWHQMGYPIQIGINLSARQFAQHNLVQRLQAILEENPIDSNKVDLEITESLAMKNSESNIATLKALKALGVKIAIDDFGTGYSSLAYLHSLPIDILKIDRSFVLNLDSKEGQAITNTIIALAKSLHLSVIAEGVELEHQEQFLSTKGCDTFQGFKYGKPMPAKAFTAWLTQFSAKPITHSQ